MSNRCQPTDTQIAIAVTREDALSKLLSAADTPRLGDCRILFNWGAFPSDHYDADTPIDRVYFGSEFCERLIPDKKCFQRVLAQIEQHNLALSLLTPMVSDKGMRQLTKILPLLPEGAEVIVNDWGVLRLLQREFPRLTPVVGRLLCKMIKDPRLPSEQWARLYPHGVQSGPFHNLLEKFGIDRLEMDVPPFAEQKDFHSADRALSVYLPFGYSVKGRMCKIGAVGLDSARKFGPGHGCNKECLRYTGKTRRDSVQGKGDLHTFQLGNTLFYRHSAQMTAAVAEAVAQQQVNRLVFAGDWHENYRTH